MKIIQFPRGWPMMEMCKGLKKIGAVVTECNFLPHPFFGNNSDICLNLQNTQYSETSQKIKEFLISVQPNYDVFHFHMILALQNRFSPRLEDFEQLKRQGKKLVIQHHGSEVRRLSLASQNNPYMRERNDYIGEETIISNLEQLSKIFDHAIVHDYELIPHIKEYYQNIHLIRHPIDLNQYLPIYPSQSNEEPLVVHAPSQRDVKGTEFILNAISQLRNEGHNRFKFKLIENLRYEDALKTYQQADIIIDQLRIGAHGVVSLEAMALGKPVICYIRGDLVDKYPGNLPIANANPETIYSVLKELLQSPTKRIDLGVKGRKYVEQYHNPTIIAKELMSLYEKL